MHQEIKNRVLHVLRIFMRNTLAIRLLVLLFSFPAPNIPAFALKELKNVQLKKFIRTASYLPYLISWVIAANSFLGETLI